MKKNPDSQLVKFLKTTFIGGAFCVVVLLAVELFKYLSTLPTPNTYFIYGVIFTSALFSICAVAYQKT